VCGIAGYVAYEGGVDAGVLRAMAASLAHRGPDGEGTWQDGACGLAHRRLSIIDLAHSSQPMTSAAGDAALVYNGELYNYRQLREELRAGGARFRTQGDTEVVLELLRQAGWEGLRRFDGMFGLALWDAPRQQLLLARDPLGIKPLFYAEPRPGTLVFGSEIKSVLCHPAVARELDLDGLRQVLRFRAVYGAGSLYRGVRQLEPGTALVASRDGIRIERFYDLVGEMTAARGRLAGVGPEEQVARGEALLREAVAKRLIADVPVGVFLSGGIDSSLIAAVVRECRAPHEPTATFSVGFADDPGSELGHARAVAKALGTEHTEVAVSEQDYLRHLATLTWVRDAPVSEPADVAIAAMSAVARETVKVVLSGEGADEVFCGYPKYGFARLPAWTSPLLRGLGPERVVRLAGAVGLDVRRARVAATALAQPTELDRLVQWFSYLERERLATLLPGLEWTAGQWQATTAPQAQALARFAAAGGDAQVRMQGVDCLCWLPGNLLERGDRMTMARGLELRVPFLDKTLAPFGLALRPELKVKGRELKRIVRTWARGRVPAEIARRPKWGFRAPLAGWFRGPLRAYLHDHLGARGGLCGSLGDRDAVAQLLSRHDRGEADLNLELWTLLVAEVWYQAVFRQADPASGPHGAQ
jgi:asparagine synthase (glutamine-hydrolysing)